MAQNRAVSQKRVRILQLMEAWMNHQGQILQIRTVVTLPIVVHIVWKEEEENISEAQILSQIEALNEDFRAMNENLGIVPEEFQPLIADVEIEFCLAETDPQGNASSGITRTHTSQNFVGTAIANGARTIFFSDNGGKDAWPTDRYINIWVGRREFALGAATFPGQASAETDGIVIDPYYFGRTGLATESFPFHLGKTLSHEMGHYFGLSHLNGPGANSDCTEDDGIEDTPLQSGTYIGECPIHPMESCGSNDMFMNIMSLTNDECLAMFTPGQKMFVMATLNTARSGLLNDISCIPTSSGEIDTQKIVFEIMPNPAGDYLSILPNPDYSADGMLFLFNSAGSLLLKKQVSSQTGVNIDIHSVDPGLYFVSLFINNKKLTKKLIIAP